MEPVRSWSSSGMVVVWRVRNAPRTFFVGRILGIINSVHLEMKIQTLSCYIVQTNKNSIFCFLRGQSITGQQLHMLIAFLEGKIHQPP